MVPDEEDIEEAADRLQNNKAHVIDEIYKLSF